MALVKVTAVINTNSKDVVLSFPNNAQQFYDSDSSLAEALSEAVEDAMSDCPVKGCTSVDCGH